MANGTNSQVQFRFQRPQDPIYRVGPVGSNMFFTSVQAAINQAVADGHTDNTNPAFIEIYPGSYAESLTLKPGVHLIGKGTTTFEGATAAGLDSPVIIVGNHTYAISVGAVRSNNRLILRGIALSCVNGITLTHSGTAPSEVLVYESVIQKQTGGDVNPALQLLNTGAGTRFRLNDCFVEHDVAGSDACDVQRSELDVRGRLSGVISANNVTLNSAFKMSNAAILRVTNVDGVTSGPFTQVILIDSGTPSVTCERATFTNTLVGGVLVQFTVSISAQFRACSLVLQDSTSKLGAGVAGNLAISSCTFNGTVSNPFTKVDPGIFMATRSFASSPIDSSYGEFYVGRGVGYATIQAAINAAASVTSILAVRKVVKIPAGTYTENLTLAEGVDLVADTESQTVKSAVALVVINGSHTFNPGGAGTVILKNIFFQDTTASPLFSVGGVGAAHLSLFDCYLTKSFAGTSQLFSVTNSGQLELVLQRCQCNLSVDGGSAFDFSGASATPLLNITDFIADFANGIQISPNTLATPVQLPLLKTPASGMQAFFGQLTITAVSTRLFELNSAFDLVFCDYIVIQQTCPEGELIKFNSNGNVEMSHNIVIMKRDGVNLNGNPALATDNGTQASGTITVNVNPTPGDTVTIRGIVFIAGTNFAIGATTSDTATNLRNAINKNTAGAIRVNVYAKVAANVVTVKSFGDANGNAYTLATSNPVAFTLPATLGGGVDGAGGTIFVGAGNTDFNGSAGGGFTNGNAGLSANLPIVVVSIYAAPFNV